MGLFRFVFILQSYLLLIFIYLLNHSITIGIIFKDLGIESDQVALPDLPNLISYAVYLLIVLITSKLILLWVPSLKDSIEVKSENIDKIYPASESFLPTFFAYVFLGLSINNWTSLFFVYVALGIFCLCSEMYMYNPLFYIFLYRFYYVEMKSGSKILVMSKYEFQLGHKKDFTRLKKINDFSYIDLNDD